MDAADPYEGLSDENRDTFKEVLALKQEDFTRFHDALVTDVQSGKYLQVAKDTLGIDFIPPTLIVMGVSKKGNIHFHTVALDTAVAEPDELKTVVTKAAAEYMEKIAVGPGRRSDIPIAISVVFEGGGVKREITDLNPCRPPESGEDVRSIALVYSGCLLKHVRNRRMVTLFQTYKDGENKTYSVDTVCDESDGEPVHCPPYLEMFGEAILELTKKTPATRTSYGLEPGMN